MTCLHEIKFLVKKNSYSSIVVCFFTIQLILMSKYKLFSYLQLNDNYFTLTSWLPWCHPQEREISCCVRAYTGIWTVTIGEELYSVFHVHWSRAAEEGMLADNCPSILLFEVSTKWHGQIFVMKKFIANSGTKFSYSQCQTKINLTVKKKQITVPSFQ